jgi:hypothetical protein
MTVRPALTGRANGVTLPSSHSLPRRRAPAESGAVASRNGREGVEGSALPTLQEEAG